MTSVVNPSAGLPSRDGGGHGRGNGHKKLPADKVDDPEWCLICDEDYHPPKECPLRRGLMMIGKMGTPRWQRESTKRLQPKKRRRRNRRRLGRGEQQPLGSRLSHQQRAESQPPERQNTEDQPRQSFQDLDDQEDLEDGVVRLVQDPHPNQQPGQTEPEPKPEKNK